MGVGRGPLPAGTVTFLFTDIEGSTRLAHELGDAWPAVLQAHHALLRDVFTRHGGVEVSTAGDSFFLAFASATDGVVASVAMQRALAARDWSPHRPIRVRMGLHTGEATIHSGDYAGLTVHAASRVESAASGGQVLVTDVTRDAMGLPDDIDFLDLGMHRLKDLPSEVHIFQVLAPGLDREFPAIRSLDTLRTNLPVPLSSFVGRADALATVHRSLDDSRLVTLCGPGGTGKTRLSIQAATERLHRHRHGTWFVELDPAEDEAGVARALADALGVKEEPGRSVLESVIAEVHEWDALLVIDNCEHVIDAAAVTIERLLRSAGAMRVLATSREPLSIGGERVWPVPPLAIEEEAVALLVDRARSVQPDFELVGADVDHAEDICRQLDGLPLAVELAAASTTTLTLAEIAAQLTDRFALLTRGTRTALDRQKTLRGAIEWSYELLDEPARAFFPRLGVFPGDFDAESVAGIFDREVPEVITDVDLLARKSLLLSTPSGRYRMLESIRAYARDRLAQRAEAEEAAERHARWFASGLIGVDSARWWGRNHDVVNDDLVAGLHWATDHDHALALAMLARLQREWIRVGRWSLGRTLSEQTLDSTADVRSDDRGAVLGQAGELALRQGDTQAARAYFEREVAAYEDIGETEMAQAALANVGLIAELEGDLDTAERLWEGAVNSRSGPIALAHLAEIARRRGDLATATERATAALAAGPADVELALQLTVMLGDIARQRGDVLTARDRYTDALERARNEGYETSIIYVSFCLASLALDAGALDEAAVHLVEAIGRGRAAHARADLAESLEAAARWLMAHGDAANAAAIIGAVDGVRAALNFPRSAADVAPYEALVAEVRGADSDFDAHVAAGHGGSLEDAVDTALWLLGPS